MLLLISKIKKLVLLLFVVVSHSLYCQDTTRTNPILFAELVFGGGGSFGEYSGFLYGGTANYQFENSLFTIRYIENPEFKFNPTLLAPTVQFPYVASKMGNTEIAILYGKRIIRDFVSYSFSAGLSNNNFQSKYRDENNQIYKYNKVHYGFSYEINIKWFNSKKERYRIYMLVPVGKPTSFGRSIGFKLLGNISNHSYLGFAVTYGFGYHKKL